MVCVFCRIIEGKEKSWKLYENDDLIVILDKYPATRGHSLVIPKTHYESITSMPLSLSAKLFCYASSLASMFEKLGAKGVNILTNSGSLAGQAIFHAHIHVIPRWRTEDHIAYTGFFGRSVIKEPDNVLNWLKPYVEDALANAKQSCSST